MTITTPQIRPSHSFLSIFQKFRSTGTATPEEKQEAKRTFTRAMVKLFGPERSTEIFTMVLTICKTMRTQFATCYGNFAMLFCLRKIF